MKEIPLTQGMVALVDDEDFEGLSRFRWCYDNGYARRKEMSDGGKWENILMHRVILNARSGIDGDHKDENTLNNRRSNLREATRSQNGSNRGRPSNNTSGFKGVSWHKHHCKWGAHIRVNWKLIHLGYFTKAEDAASAYATAAREYFGEFYREESIHTTATSC